MDQDFDFFELILLQRIAGRKENSYLEKLAPEVSTGFFEVANRVGSLKIKGFLDIKPALGMSEIILNEKANELFLIANKKAEEKTCDVVDKEILKEIYNGLDELTSLQNKLKIRNSDLALHLHKLTINSYIDYNIGNNTVKFVLTEKGFAKAHHEKKSSSQQQDGEVDQPIDKKEVPEDVKELLGTDSKSKDEQLPTQQKEYEPQTPKQYNSKLEYILDRYKLQIIASIIILLIAIGILIYGLMKENIY